MNLSDGFIRAPHRHQPADGGDRACSAPSPTGRCRSAICPTSTFPRSWSRRSCPAPVPKRWARRWRRRSRTSSPRSPGLESMTSVNSLGSTQITLEFDLDRSLDGAAVDVQGAITQASRLLPQGMPTPPTFTKVNPADQPILYLVITSTTLPAWTLDEWAETRIAQRISQVSGVAQVQVLGAQKYAVHVQLDPHAAGVAPDRHQRSRERAARLERQRADRQHHRAARAFTLQATGQLMNADRVQGHGGRLPQRRARPPRTSWAGASTAPRTRTRRPGSTTRTQSESARHHARHPAPARHQHDRRRRRA